MATKVSTLRGTEPIILCLKDSALGTAISLAVELRGWVYPLLTEPMTIPGDGRTLGVINQDGTLCYNPDLSSFEIEDLEINNQSVIQESARKAFIAINRRLTEYGALQKEALRGRTVIILGDIIRNQLEIGAAREFLKSVTVNKTISLVGNIIPNGQTTLFLESNESTFLDVIPYMFDDEHYFEQPDNMSITDQRRIAMNIAQFWT